MHQQISLTPPGLFGLFVRAIAMLMCMYGLTLGIDGAWGLFTTILFGQIGDAAFLNTVLTAIIPMFAYLLGAVLLVRNAERIVRIAYPHRADCCDKCGYDLRESPGRCPECGAVPA